MLLPQSSLYLGQFVPILLLLQHPSLRKGQLLLPIRLYLFLLLLELSLAESVLAHRPVLLLVKLLEGFLILLHVQVQPYQGYHSHQSQEPFERQHNIRGDSVRKGDVVEYGEEASEGQTNELANNQEDVLEGRKVGSQDDQHHHIHCLHSGYDLKSIIEPF
jgi:hypothetical protein